MSEYIGMRIIPRHDGKWDVNKSYEPLVMVVDGNGDSYMSRKAVPAGTELSNENYWAFCQSFSGQLKAMGDHMDETVEKMVKENEETINAVSRTCEDTVAAVNKTAEENIAAISQKADETVSAVNKTCGDIVDSVTEKTDSVVADTKQVQTDLTARMDSIEARQDANVSASTDSNSDYAAEVVDARVDTDGNTHASLEKRLNEEIGALKDFDGEIYSRDYFEELTQASPLFSKTEGVTVNSTGGIAEGFSSYVLYQMAAPKDFELYFDMEEVKEKGRLYVAIGYGGTRCRYFPSEEEDTLPTADNRLSVAKGETLYVSVYAASHASATNEEFEFYWNGVPCLSGEIVLSPAHEERIREIAAAEAGTAGEAAVTEAVDGMEADLIDKTVFTESDQDSALFEIESGMTVSESGVPTDRFANYVLFQMEAKRDFEMYFDPDVITGNGWTYIAVGYGGARYRYYKDQGEDTLPKEGSRLAVEAGQMLYISVLSEAYAPGKGGKFSLFWNYGFTFSDDMQFNSSHKETIRAIAGEEAETAAGEAEESVMAYIGEHVVDGSRFTLVTQDTPMFTVQEGVTFNGTNQIYTLAQYNLYQFTAKKDLRIYFDMDELDAKIPYLALGVGSQRYRLYLSNSENTLPTEDAPVSVAKGETVNISVQRLDVTQYGEKFAFYCNIGDVLADSLAFNGSHESRIREIAAEEAEDAGGDVRAELQDSLRERDTRLIVESHDGYFYYYQKASREDTFLRCQFSYYKSESTNAEGWNQYLVDAVSCADGEYTKLHPVVVGGEWEMAVRLFSAPDFIGCRNHGSEVMRTVKFFADGQEWTPAEGLGFSCRELAVVEVSDMYDPNDEETVVGTHYKEYHMTGTEIRIRQRIDWLLDERLTYSYVCMLPIARGKDKASDVQVTDTCFDDLDYTDYDISEGDFSGRPKTFKHGITRYWLRSAETGVSAEVGVSIENEPEESTSFVQNTTDMYNKVYFSYCGSDYSVKAGDVWKWEGWYRLNIS